MTSYIANRLWGGGSSTPKPTKPRPLTPKLETQHAEYPPPHQSHHHDWEDVHPPISASSVSPDADEASYERLGYSQVDTADPQRLISGLREENKWLIQQLDEVVTAKAKLEAEKEGWAKKGKELRHASRSERDRERNGSSTQAYLGKEREKDTTTADVLKEENDKLKTMLQRQTQQLEHASNETKRIRKERDALVGTHEKEIEGWKASSQQQAQHIEHLSAERERLRKEWETKAANLTAEIEKLKLTHSKQSEETKAALAEVNRDRRVTHSELHKARQSLDTYASELDRNVFEVGQLRRELSSAKETHAKATELRQRFEAQSKELKIARDESSALKKEFNQISTLLEDRTSELKGAQSFLTTADAFSGSEVTNTLQRLNAEVLQSTAFMAESMVELFVPSVTKLDSKTDDQVAGGKRVSAVIGGAIVHFLGTKKHKDDPILIQIAFQAYLTYVLRWIAAAWIIGGEEDHNQFIDTIYQSVREQEAQAIAGRWRALTRAHVPHTRFDEFQLTSQMATKAISGLSDILLAAGCTAPKSDIVSGLSSKFTDKISLLVSLAIRVNKIIGEDVTSGDLEVLAVPPATAFDGTTMEDSYDDESSPSTRGRTMPKALCATDLGLRKKTRVGMVGEKEKQWEIKMLLKPKVALESVVDIMDE